MVDIRCRIDEKDGVAGFFIWDGTERIYTSRWFSDENLAPILREFLVRLETVLKEKLKIKE